MGQAVIVKAQSEILKKDVLELFNSLAISEVQLHGEERVRSASTLYSFKSRLKLCLFIAALD